MQRQYNLRNPAVKRLMREAQELREPTEQYHAQPLEDNLFEWHFTIRGPADSDFDNGLYHGRIVLPPEYPMKPPSIILLTPNGRFEVNKKICLSISGYHPESWQPSWSIRTALLAIVGFMPTHGGGAIGSLDYTSQERKVLAKRSQCWKCPSCGDISNVLPQVTEASKETNKEARELAAQISFQAEKEKRPSEGVRESGDNSTSSVSQSPPTSTLPTDSVTNSSTAPVTTTPVQQPSPIGQPLPPANSFRFPFPPPPFPAFPMGNHWQSVTNIIQPGPTSTAPSTFPMPFVSRPFHPMFPPHIFTGQPPMFPPGWPRPGFPMANTPNTSVLSPTTHPVTTSSSLPATSQSSVSESLTTPTISADSQHARSGEDNSQSSQGDRSGADNSRPATSTTQSDSRSSVRHRLSRAQPVGNAAARATTSQPTEARRGDPVTLILALMILIVALLLMRRLYMEPPV